MLSILNFPVSDCGNNRFRVDVRYASEKGEVQNRTSRLLNSLTYSLINFLCRSVMSRGFFPLLRVITGIKCEPHGLASFSLRTWGLNQQVSALNRMWK